jgi:conjugative transfer signal peptidase TraF
MSLDEPTETTHIAGARDHASSVSRWIGKICVTGGLLCLVTASIAARAGIVINITPSIPIGLYQQSPYRAGMPMTPETLVLACLPSHTATLGQSRHYINDVAHGRCASHTTPIGKHVLAVTGDTIVFTARGFVRHGHLVVGTAPLPRDHAGRRLQHIPFRQYIIGANEYWLYTTRPDSWDSRYWGAISTPAIIGVLTPMWLWPSRTPCGSASPHD